jgi:D-alanyl-D-alanine carboxypeptidase
MNTRVAALVVVFLIVGISALYGVRSQPNAKAETSPTHSLSDPASIWVVVNKRRPLQPKNYMPSDLVVPKLQLRDNITSDERLVRSETAHALGTMAAAAQKDGLTLTLESGYRSYQLQVDTYDFYVQQQGQTIADSQSARPGYSEHQTGLAADIGGTTNPDCNVRSCFAEEPEGKWLAANAYRYGFIIRYVPDKTAVTGYEPEPWHVRYVGTELSQKMHDNHIETLEEYFKLPAAPNY